MCPADQHAATDTLSASAVEVIHRAVNDSGSLTRSWAEVHIDSLGDAYYAELVAVTAVIVAIDVYTRAVGDGQHDLLAPIEGPPAAERPDDVGDVGAWIPMTQTKQLANVSRALSLVPRTNATWRALVTESYSRGPEMLELTWQRALDAAPDRAHRGAGLATAAVLLLNVEPHGAAPCERLGTRHDHRSGRGSRARRRDPVG